MPRPRILLYSHDTYGLGHLRRSLAIAESISRHIPRSRQLLVTGSTVAGAFGLPPRLDIVKLPALSKRSSGAYMPRTLPLSLEETIRWRAEMIYQSVVHFRPDLILVDKAPAGVLDEFLPALLHARHQMQETRIVFGMRDIEDAPEITRVDWKEHGIIPLLENYYDAILLYGQRSVFDPVEAYGLPDSVAGKILECGYIARQDAIRPQRAPRRPAGAGEAPFMLVTAGGGGDGQALIDAAVGMYEQGLANGIRAVVVTGPLMPQQERSSLAERARALPIDFLEFTPNLASYLASADVVVSMAGYNTVCEILSHHRRAVLVPRAQVRQEQKIRSDRLAALGLVEKIAPEELSAESLWRSVQAALQREPPEVTLNMDGLANATRALASILNAPDTLPYRLPAGLFASVQRPAKFPAMKQEKLS